jgi:hypothetical protein
MGKMVFLGTAPAARLQFSFCLRLILCACVSALAFL